MFITKKERTMPNPVIHFEITGKDGPRIQKFYTDLFGWEINSNNPIGYGVVDTKTNEGIKGGIYKAPHDVPFLTLYVRVDDLQKFLDKAERLGGQAVVPPTPVPGVGSYAFFKDTDGNIVGLFKELEK